jgi:DnaJ-class molecular chaperone
MVSDSHFEILGVSRHSTQGEIKKAYRRLIKKWHPDKFHHQPDKLSKAVEFSKLINEAFELLKNYIPPGTIAPTKKQHFEDSKSASKRTGKPVFHRVKVNSTKIWSIGYDALTKIMEVEFYEDGIVHYYDVPEAVYNAFRYADPVDDYLHANISWKYRWEMI